MKIMPLSKKRKISAAVDQQEGTVLEEASSLATAVAEPHDPTASEEPRPEINTEIKHASTTQAAAQNEERQERFKALQARAVRYSSHLLSSEIYTFAALEPLVSILADIVCRRNPHNEISRKQPQSRKDWPPTPTS